MMERDDIVDAIKKELDVEPSASFAAGVRRRIDSQPAQNRVGGRTVVGILAVAMILALVAGRAFRHTQAPQSRDHTVAGGPLVPAVAPQARESSPMKPRARPLPPMNRSARRDDAAGLQASSSRVFDPFRDVLVPESEKHSMPLLIAYKGEDLQLDLTAWSIDEPVRIVALSPLPRLVIAPLGELAQLAASN